MSDLKSMMRVSILHEQGVKMDDLLESASKRQLGHDGAKQALRQVAKNLSGLAALVDRDLDEQKLPTEPLQIAAYAKQLLDKAVSSVLMTAQQQEGLQIAAQGEMQAYQRLVESLKKEIQQEAARLEAMKQAIASGAIVVEDASLQQPDDIEAVPRDRPVGARPAMSIAEQRRTEDAAEAAPPPPPPMPNGKRKRKRDAANP
jgi:hypothetical protein